MYRGLKKWLMRSNGNVAWFFFIVFGAIIVDIGIEQMEHEAKEVLSVLGPAFKAVRK